MADEIKINAPDFHANVTFNVTGEAKIREQQDEIARLSKQIADSVEETERLNRKITETETKLNELSNEYADFKVRTGSGALDDELQQLKNTAFRASTEFRAIMTSLNLDQLRSSTDEEIREKAQAIYADVDKGLKTVSQAVSEVKANFSGLLIENSSKSGGLFDAQMVQSYTAALEHLSEIISDVYNKLSDIQEKGIGVIGAGAGGVVGSGQVENIFKQIADGAANMSDEVVNAYDPIISIVKAITEYASIDENRLIAVSSSFRGIAAIGTGHYGTKSIENIVYLAKQLSQLSDGGSYAIRFDFTGIDGISDAKVSKASLSNLATYIPQLAAANYDNLSKISSITLIHFNDLKVSKASLENMATYIPQIADVNADNLIKLSQADLTGFNDVRVNKTSIESIAQMAKISQIINDIKPSFDEYVEMQRRVADEARVRAENEKAAADAAERAGRSMVSGGGNGPGGSGPDNPDNNELLKLTEKFDTETGRLVSTTRQYKDAESGLTTTLNTRLDKQGDLIESTTELSKSFKSTFATDMESANVDKQIAGIAAKIGKLREVVSSVPETDDTRAEMNSLLGMLSEYEKELGELDAAYVTTGNHEEFTLGLTRLTTKLADATTSVSAFSKEYKSEFATAMESANVDKQIAGIAAKIGKLREVVSSVPETDDTRAEMNSLLGMLSEYEKELGELDAAYAETGNHDEFASGLARMNAKLADATTSVSAFSKAYKSEFATAMESANVDKQIESVTSKINSLKTSVSDIAENFETQESRNGLLDQLSEYEERLNALRDAYAETGNHDEFAKGLVKLQTDLIGATTRVREFTKAYKDSVPDQVMAKFDDVRDAYNKVSEYISNNSNMAGSGEYKQLESLRDNLLFATLEAKDTKDRISSISEQDLSDINKQVASLGGSMSNVRGESVGLAGSIGSIAKAFAVWEIAWSGFRRLANGIRDVIENVRNLDSAMTELRKVTNETETAYERFFNNASDRARSLGATFVDTIQASADFARLGYSLSESAELADAALVYKNVGDGIASISEASSSVISTMKAFNVEAKDAMTIVDRFNEVGNNFAISSSGIGEALLNSASALAAANNTLDESIAIITAANNVVQNPNKVGTALKTVSMFLRAAKTEAEDAGESTEGMASSVSELRRELLSLTKGRVDIQLDSGTFKSTYQILKELSEVWNDLSDISRANILERIGGKRNANVVMALMTNFQTAEKVLQTAAESSGSALAENEKYLDSINGKVSQFQAALEAFSSTLIDSGIAKEVISFGTSIIDLLTHATQSIGSTVAAVGALTAAVSTFIAARNKGDTIGFFGLVDGGISVDITGIKGIISDFNRLATESKQSQEAFVKSLGSSNPTLAEYLTNLDTGVATLDGYKKACKDAGVSANSLGVSSKAASIGVTALNIAVNTLLSAGVAFIIQGIVSAVSHLTHAVDEAVESSNKLNNEFRDFQATNSSNISTLKSLREEFESLSSGVNRYGENISLTSDEYERYKSIVSQVIDISPTLSEGYSTENGYLVDKNELIERAIELEEREYRQRLLTMSTTDSLVESTKGAIAKYGELVDGDMATASDNLKQSLRDVYGFDITDAANVDLSKKILEAFGVTDIEAEIDKYMGDDGFYNFSLFWNDYADKVAQGFGKFDDSTDYISAGYDSLEEYQVVLGKLEDAAIRYINVRNQLQGLNSDVENQLKNTALSNETYANLGSEAQGIVSHFIEQIDIESLSKRNFFGILIPDEAALDEAKLKITKFINSLTPEIQDKVQSAFSLNDMFQASEINVGEFRTSLEKVLGELKGMGLDDESINYIRLSLQTDVVDEQISAISDAIGNVGGKYDEAIAHMSSHDLTVAYKIISEYGSMSFEELQEKIKWLRYEGSSKVNPLDFSDMITNLEDASNGLDGIISAMDRLRDGTALTKQEVANLALQYPKLLEQEGLFVDGSIAGQETLLNSILEMNEARYDAQIDEKIAELKATEQCIQDQIDLETQKDNIIAALNAMSVNGKVQDEEALVQYISELNDLQGRNFVTMQDGELTVVDEALQEKISAEEGYAIDATDDVWGPYAKTIATAHVQGYDHSLTATDNYKTKLTSKVKDIAQNTWAKLGELMNDVKNGKFDTARSVNTYFAEEFSGKKKGYSSVNDLALGYLESKGIDTSVDTSGIDADVDGITITFEGGGKDGARTYINDDPLEAWISNQEEAAKNRREALNLYADKVKNTIENLEALKGLDLTGIYGSKSKGSGSSGSSSSKGSSIDEYQADVDQFYLATKKLEEAQNNSNDLKKELQRAETPEDRIRLSNDLIQAYTNEIDAERNLMDQKQQTIAKNADALRALGFNVSYDAGNNKLIINNLEHLNELAAESPGKYKTLQEATNALRKETEDLIDTTEKLNDDNVDAADRIQDLNYEIEDLKKGEVPDSVKEIEEYLADIDEYYAAVKRLEEAQEKRASIEKEIQHVDDPSDKIKKSKQLIQAYMDEADAERNLMNQKSLTIAKNAETLRNLGFLVDYDASGNKLFIKNLEHLNELTASSAGKYDTLQEATNALRKETEELINTTEQLNDDNIEAAGTIEDLGYEVLETKDNIIDYIEEIYDKQTEAYKKIIDLRKELIESAKDEYDYESDVAEKVKEIAELQSRIDQLSLDDSRSARAERNSLMQELQEKQSELSETQSDHSKDAQLEALDKMAEDYEKQKDNELETLRNTVNDTEELWTAFYQTILGQNVSIGNSINVEIADAWLRAAQAVREYDSTVGGIIENGAGVVTGVKTPKFHDGGVVGGGNLDRDEVLAILQKGEVVLNDAKQKGLYRIIDFQEELSDRLGTALRSMPISDVVSDVKSLFHDASVVAGESRSSLVFEPHIEVTIQHDGSNSAEAARSFGRQIADTALENLYEAFERRGVNSNRGSRLKP